MNILKITNSKQEHRRYIFPIFAILLFIGSINLSAQNRKLTLSLENVSLRQLFNSIEKQTDYKFLYRDFILDNKKDLSIKVEGKEITYVLDQVLPGKELQYKIQGNNINIIRKPVASAGTSITVKGTVVDESGEPLIGVSVVQKGVVSNSRVTDINGNFLMTVQPGAVLSFKYIGYLSEEVTVKEDKTLRIRLAEDAKKLDEVVVIGYGTAQRKSVVGAVDQINSKKIEDRPVSNLSQALQGVAANLTIQQKSMNPNDNQLNINIRGVGTMGNNDPLVVIDGLVTSLSSLSQLNPSDVENISVLKDAGSAAIYGSRSANGVILVTTKKGKLDTKPVIRVNTLVGIQSPNVLYKPVAGFENAILKDEAAFNTGNPLPYSPAQIQDLKANGAGSEWFLDQILQNALQQNYSLSLSGGSSNSSYMVSAGYVNQRSNFVSGSNPSYGMDRYNFRTNLVNQYGKFKLTTILSYNRTESNAPNASTGNLMADGGRIPNYYYYQQKASNGHYLINDVLSQFTPLGSLEAAGFNKYDTDYINGSTTGEMKIFKGLTAKAMAGIDLYADHRYSRGLEVPYYSSETATAPSIVQNVGGSTSDWNEKRYTINTQFLLDYDRTFNKIHHVGGLLGVSNEAYSRYSNEIWMNYVDPNLGIPTSQTALAGNIGGKTTPMNTTKSDIASAFGRLSYSYKDKYYGEASFRYDGSSKFAQGHRWGFFPSLSGGWRISEESFMDSYKSKVGDLKFRGSYGVLGNQNVGDYNFLTVYTTYNNSYGFNGVSASGTGFQLGNPILSWEQSANFNLGLDATFFDNNLYASFDYFNKETSGILLNPITPSVLGTTVGMQNSGKMQNRGWELTIGYHAKTGDFKHNISFNLADSRNKVITFTGNEVIRSGDKTDIIRVGAPFASYYGYKTDGFFKSYADIQNSAIPVGLDASQLAPGDVKYKDINHDGVIDSKDRQILGNAFPRFTFGLTYDVTWKGFDLNMLIQGVGKRTMFLRGELIEPFHANYSYVIYQHQLDFWTPTNTDSKWPRLALPGSTSDVNNYGYSSQTQIMNAAYIRLKNIAIGYTIPKKITSRFGVQKLHLSVNAQNLLTFSPLSFYDPESSEYGNDMGGSGSGPGANSGRSYPTLKYVGFGLDLEF
jgi:TonB-linked outer membrane protein, SusC/RagA family